MSNSVQIAHHTVGAGSPCFIVAEIGINHNGDIEMAKKLIDVAVHSGCQAVKFQKRTVDVVYTAEELARPRENPFGPTNGHLKRGLEFGKDQYSVLFNYAHEKKILCSASCWDEKSVDFMEQFNPSFYKIASASLTDKNLLKRHKETKKPIILSTGMSTMGEIRQAVEVLGSDKLIILHCTSTYPSKPEELNLNAIRTFQKEFNCPIGYSGHEVGLATTLAAVALGACVVERHITLDRSLWGSDQSASVEPQGFERLVRDIRSVETALGDGVKIVYESEKPILEKLRRVGH